MRPAHRALNWTPNPTILKSMSVTHEAKARKPSSSGGSLTIADPRHTLGNIARSHQVLDLLAGDAFVKKNV